MFPTELVAAIISEVDTRSDLLSLRLVCHQFHSLTTPSAFRRVQVKGTVTGAKNLAQLQKSDLADFVHELEFTHNTENEANTNISLAKAFSALARFEKLEKLVFNFCPYYEFEEENATKSPSHCAWLQHALLDALINSPLPPLLSALSLVNVIAHYDELFEEDSFCQLMQKLNFFSLDTLTDPETEDYYVEPSYTDFWDKNVSEHIITPSSSLVSLSIKSDRMTILYSLGTNNSQKPLFPNLVHLALTDILFSEGIKEFILDHSASLTHLELDDCRMGDEEVPPNTVNTWNYFYSRIQQEMEHLISFSVAHSQELNVSESGDYFISTLDYDGWILGLFEEDDEVNDLFQQDKLALDNLQAAVRLRSNTAIE